jgi:predicted GIY-YIG superfamily endonuclease
MYFYIYYQMPCSKCKQTGHNARTCTGGTGEAGDAIRSQAPSIPPTTEEATVIIAVPPVVPEKIKRFYCYILGQTNFLNKGGTLNGGYAGGTPRTYNGYTVDLRHRLRQHNGEIKGGAFATKNRGPWEFIAVMTCLEWTNVRAMKVEWLIRYPTRKKPRPTEFSGPQGRINSLVEVVNRMDEPSIHLYVNPLFYDSVKLPDKVKLFRSMDAGF